MGKRHYRSIVVAAAAALLVVVAPTARTSSGPAAIVFPDSSGAVETLSASGSIDIQNPFFQVLGTNGRACVTCHQPSDAWSVTPAHIQARFDSTGGRDPIFRTNDGSNCQDADISTLEKRRAAFSLLLNKGLIRVGLAIPSNADFQLLSVDDPYGCRSGSGELSMYRRPLPTANLKFLSTVMWDGRETVSADFKENFRHQALDATLGHAQADAAPADAQLNAIVAFETALFSAQKLDFRAGDLSAGTAGGGAKQLMDQPFSIGINDPLGADPSKFDPAAFTIFQSWSKPGFGARQAIARGEDIFNHHQFQIAGVAGLNHGDSITGTCTVCHNTPNAGNHSVPLAINVGVSDPSRRTPDLPLYTFACSDGRQVQTTDPGRAMITGKCADIGKTKGPVLRSLAARAPYFHNGSAATLADVVKFYDTRFNIGLTDGEKADLIAFLSAL